MKSAICKPCRKAFNFPRLYGRKVSEQKCKHCGASLFEAYDCGFGDGGYRWFAVLPDMGYRVGVVAAEYIRFDGKSKQPKAKA